MSSFTKKIKKNKYGLKNGKARIVPPDPSSPDTNKWRYVTNNNGKIEEYDIIQVVMKLAGCNYDTALDYLGDIYGIHITDLKNSNYVRKPITFDRSKGFTQADRINAIKNLSLNTFFDKE